MKKGFIIFIAAVVIAFVGLFTYNTVIASKSAPEVNYTTLDGRNFTTQDLQGKVTMVKFWATDCVTCMRQMPDTMANYAKYKDQGYETVAVAMKHDKTEAINRLIQERGYDFPIVHDSDGSIAKAFGDVRFTPIAFLVDRKGKIIKSFIGDYDQRLFIEELERALAHS